MVPFINSWASGIVVAVIIGSILEMVLPENNNKKYIKTVIGLFILFTIVSPVIAKFSGGIDLSAIRKYENYLEMETTPTIANVSQEQDKNLEKVYLEKLKEDIQNRLLQIGYSASNIKLTIDTKEQSYGIITSISLNVSKKAKGVENISKIEIEVQKQENSVKEEITEKEKKTIKDFLNTNYDIAKDKIIIL